MPQAAGENVPTASSVSTAGPPVASSRSPLFPSPLAATAPLPAPSHSMPTCFTPKSSAACRRNRTVSVSKSTAFSASPSTAIAGASSARTARLTRSGFSPESPSESCHWIVISRDSSMNSGGVVIVAPAGTMAMPSTFAAARSRFAVARTSAVLPFTTASTPPRASF